MKRIEHARTSLPRCSLTDAESPSAAGLRRTRLARRSAPATDMEVLRNIRVGASSGSWVRAELVGTLPWQHRWASYRHTQQWGTEGHTNILGNIVITYSQTFIYRASFRQAFLRQWGGPENRIMVYFKRLIHKADKTVSQRTRTSSDKALIMRAR